MRPAIMSLYFQIFCKNSFNHGERNGQRNICIYTILFAGELNQQIINHLGNLMSDSFSIYVKKGKKFRVKTTLQEMNPHSKDGFFLELLRFRRVLLPETQLTWKKKVLPRTTCVETFQL